MNWFEQLDVRLGGQLEKERKEKGRQYLLWPDLSRLQLLICLRPVTTLDCPAQTAQLSSLTQMHPCQASCLFDLLSDMKYKKENLISHRTEVIFCSGLMSRRQTWKLLLESFKWKGVRVLSVQLSLKAVLFLEADSCLFLLDLWLDDVPWGVAWTWSDLDDVP